MNVWMVKWLPLVAFFSIMVMPSILDIHVLPMLVVPLILLVWLAASIWLNGIYIEKKSVYLVGLLLFSQSYLWLSGSLSSTESMLLGCVWVFVAFLLWNQASFLTRYVKIYYLSLLIAGLLWILVAAIVWLGWTDGKAISFGFIGLTQDMQYKPTGPFANGNVFGLMMLCAWIVSVYFWLRRSSNSKLTLLLALVFLIWVFASLSRGAWLAWLLSFMLFAFMLGQKKMWKEITILCVTAFLAWFLASFLVHYNLENTDISARAESMLSASGARLVLYPSVFEVWKDHWLLGVGLGNLGGHYLIGQAKAFSYLSPDFFGLGATYNAHNHFLQAISEGGLIGLILWLAVSFVLFRALWRNGLDLKKEAWLPLLIALVIWVQGLVNISMIEPIPFFMFFLFLSIGVSSQVDKGKFRKRFLNQQIVSVILLVISSMLIFQSVVLTQNWRIFERMQLANNGSEKAALVSVLIEYDYIYPRLIQQIAIDMISRKETTANLVKLKRQFQRALAMEEWPMLYQGLFYSYVLEKNWVKACELGIFLKQQHWENDKNSMVYNQACESKRIDSFTLGWR